MLMEGKEQESCMAYKRPVSGKRRVLSGSFLPLPSSPSYRLIIPLGFQSMKLVISTCVALDYMFCKVVVVTFLQRTCIPLSDELRYVNFKVRLQMASLGNRQQNYINKILRERSNHPQANFLFVMKLASNDIYIEYLFKLGVPVYSVVRLTR